LSAGFLLFCASVGFRAALSANSVSNDFLFWTVFFFGILVSVVPLWRGLLWSDSGPVLLPIRPRVAAALEGMTFAALAGIPLVLGWLAFWWNLGESVGPEVNAMGSVGPVVVAEGLFVACAAVAAQFDGRRAPLTIWCLVALPGLAGAAVFAAFMADDSAFILIAAAIGSLFLVAGALFGAAKVARRLATRRTAVPGVRQGRLDRLAIDARAEIIRVVLISGILTLAAWFGVEVFLDQVVGATRANTLFSSILGGLVVILPMLPRIQLLDAQLGIRRSEVPTLDAWSLLPVHPRALRTRMIALVVAPLMTGAVVDVGFAFFRADAQGWIQGMALVHFAASLVLAVVGGGFTMARLPRSARS